MNRKTRILLSALAAVSATSVIASCGVKKEPSVETPSSPSSSEIVTLSSIDVEGYQEEYGLNDKISTKGVKVYANYSDGTKKDVTSTAQINTSSVNTSKVGTYTVTVKFDNLTTTYTVKVLDYVFDSIKVDEDASKTEFGLYAAPDFSQTNVYAVYKSPVNDTTKDVSVPYEDCSFEVKNSKGEVVETLDELGEYSVTVTYNEATTTYKIYCVTAKNAGSVEEAIALIGQNEDTVDSGSYVHNSYDGSYSEFKDYVIGKNYVKVLTKAPSYDGSEYGYNNYYYSLNDKNEIFAVKTGVNKVDGSYVEDSNSAQISEYDQDGYKATSNNARGIAFDILASGNQDFQTYGFGNLVAGFYEVYKESVDTTKSEYKGTLKHIVDENGNGVEGYSFTFNYVYGSSDIAYFKTISIEFTLTDTGAIAKAYASVTNYVSNENPYFKISELNTKALPEDLGIELISGTDEAGAALYSFKVKERTEGNTYVTGRTDTYTVSQTSNLKSDDSEVEFVARKQIVSDYKMYIKKENGDEEVANGASFDIDLDNADVAVDAGGHRFEFKFKVGDITPSSVNTGLAQVSISITGEAYDGTHVDSSEFTGYTYAYVRSTEDGYYTIQIARAGTYTVTVKAQDVVKSFTYNVQFEAPTSIGSAVYDGETGGFVETSTFDCYTTNEIYFDAVIAKYFEQGYTAKVQKLVDGAYVDVDSSKVTLVKGNYEVSGEEVECYKFKASEAGTYKVTLIGATPDNASKSAATCDVTVNVSDVPSVDDIVKGNYSYAYEAFVSSDEIYKVVFSQPDDNKGTVTITKKYDSSKVQVASYEYKDSKFVIKTTSNTLELENGAEFDVEISAYYKLSVKHSGTGVSYTLSEPTSDITDKEWALLANKYESTDLNTLYLFRQGSKKGSGTVEITETDKSAVYSYVYDNDTKELKTTFVSGSELEYGKTLQIFVSDEKITVKSSDAEYDLEEYIDLEALCSGEYMLTLSDGYSDTEYTISFIDDNKVELSSNNGSTEKKGVYSWVYNTETKAFKLTKVSGDKFSAIANSLCVVGGVLCYKGNVMVDGNIVATTIECTRVVKFSDSYVGNWAGVDSYDDSKVSVTINSTSVVVDGVSVSGTFTITSQNGNVYTLKGQRSDVLVLTVDEDTIHFDYSNGYVTCDLSRETLSVDSSLVGKWHGYNEDARDDEDVVIREDSLTYGGYSYKLTSYENNVYTFSDGTYSCYITVDGSTITFKFGETEFVITDASTVIVTFDETYTGSYHDNINGYALVIGTHSISYNGFDATSIKEHTDGTYTFDITDDTEYTQNYTMYKNGTSIIVYPTGYSYDKSMQTEFVKDPDTITSLLTNNTYTGKDANGITYEIQIVSNVITIDDYDYTIVSSKTTDSFIHAENLDGYWIELTLNNDGTISYADDMSNTATLSKQSDEVTTIDESYVGSWSNEEKDTYVTITSTSITINGFEATSITSDDGRYLVTTEEEVTYEVFLDSYDENTLHIRVEGEYYNTIDLTNGNSGTTTAGQIPESYCGFYGDYDVLIGSSTLEINDVEITEYSYDSETETISFTYNGEDATIVFGENSLTLTVGSSDPVTYSKQQ